MFDFLVFIGRFQPFHIGHAQVLAQALAQSQQVIMLIGSARQPRNTRNPFTVSERSEMILSSLAAEQAARVHCYPLDDCLYNDALWVKTVQEAVQTVVSRQSDGGQLKIGLIGHQKDHSSYYLRLFPQWHSVDVENFQSLSATPLRDAYLLGKTLDNTLLPLATQQVLQRFKQQPVYQDLAAEAAFIEQYKQAWSVAPYAPTFVTVDAVVLQAGHILLVERKTRPGKGLFALPGGFVDAQETLIAACVRELQEETQLGVPETVLYGALKAQRVFDEPNRSARGRTITHAFMFEFAPDVALPYVKGGDDAKSAFWLPLSELTPEYLFEDHFHIINAML
ncbi:bifunctional nicotinamide-nucleotide adenylyltransferase/Nudix hydroxylase [Agitococcus lubricus]|uniref:bifunctional nicotinamide-nucleotide adenylyltransferase/Nudix hydroxylase n=1 Tax=Agitococcus lubricus TaxID=1077255 RepID=UPI001EFC425A|nr:bifunctional nicotinamide-nucleotide adenylyltransferase/Nudix hydroxylase [Agitococcus lubricus]